MTLYDRIKADRLAAMKARDELRRNLLGTLLAAAAKETKAPDDATVVKAIRAFLKSVEETAAVLVAAGKGTADQDAERGILEAYLPATLGEAELDASIAEIVAGLPDRTPKAMGQVMASLKARHGDALDGKVASAKVRAALAD